MKTKLEVLNETVEYYSSKPKDRRAKTELYCEYYTEDGRMCAFGRTLDHPENFKGENCSANQLIDIHGWGIVKEEYRIEDITFWSSLQHLHDVDAMWTDTGLSEEGSMEVNRLKEVYAN